ncbi:hypothetical protein GCM10023260_07790 [Bartonella acomydis]|uniref:Uncharacterized protein n=1 Tax=Bartonella acomydis TaxID=686234 RepID=A0ABP9MQ04_9HYPH
MDVEIRVLVCLLRSKCNEFYFADKKIHFIVYSFISEDILRKVRFRGASISHYNMEEQAAQEALGCGYNTDCRGVWFILAIFSLRLSERT